MKLWKHVVTGSVAAALIFVSSGCAYMHVQRPLDTNFSSTPLGSKEGRADSYSLLWLVAWGDAGTRAAAMQGGIKTIHYADTDMKSILLGAYTRVTTVVYGD